MRQFLFAIIVLFSSSLYAQDLDPAVISWHRTGYDFEKLFVEPDFTAKNCKKKVKTFTGCLMALQSLLSSIEDNEQVIQFNGADKLEILDSDPQPEIKSYEEYKARLKQKRESYALAFEMGAADQIDALFEAVKQEVEFRVPEVEKAHVAGMTYNFFLREAYDPHSKFMPQESFAPKAEEYFGIGARVTSYFSKDEDLKMTISLNPFKGSPAEAAGLKKGDLLLEVNGESVKELAPGEAVKLLKGVSGTTVDLKVNRVCNGEEEAVTVTRGPIVRLPDWVADSKFISLEQHSDLEGVCGTERMPVKGEKQAMYIPLTTFSERRGQDMCGEFYGLQIKDLNNPDSQGMILDLRGNPGGNLHVVACMLDSLISAEGPMILQQPVRYGEVQKDAKAKVSFRFRKRGRIAQQNGPPIIYNRNIMVLVDPGAASASEIFAGVIQDMKRGWVIGVRTHGKGSVQTVRRHMLRPGMVEPTDTPLLLARTTAIYTLPSGRSPQGVGIIPDISVDQLGEVVSYDEDKPAGEAELHNSIVYDNMSWQQNRPGKVLMLDQCTHENGTHSEDYLLKRQSEERYSRPFVANYQLEMAKDALLCAEARPDVIY